MLLYIYMCHHVFIKKVKETGLEVILSKAKNAVVWVSITVIYCPLS